MKKMV
jgi:hypothetical protein